MMRALVVLFALTLGASVNAQTLTGPSVNVGITLCGKLIGANMNSTADQAIAITPPSANYAVFRYYFVNPSASFAAGSAAGGIYTAAAKGGAQILASTTTFTSVNATGQNANNNALQPNGNPVTVNVTTQYLSLTTPEGAAKTLDIYVLCLPAGP